jgi:hypothetical protein
MPIGVTCQDANKSCMAETCVDGAWKCPDGTTEVALVPGQCAQ